MQATLADWIAGPTKEQSSDNDDANDTADRAGCSHEEIGNILVCCDHRGTLDFPVLYHCDVWH